MPAPSSIQGARDTYQVTAEVGAGSHAVVYRGRGSDGREYAIKVLRRECVTQAEVRRNFLQEFDLLQAADGVVRVPAAGELFEVGGVPHMVIDFVPGVSLKQKLGSPMKPVTESTAVAWALKLCETLSQLHQRNIIYKDLNPNNIIISPRDEPWIIDFGIARSYKAGKAQDTTLFGTEGFASPEHYGSAQTDARSDVYSLGATLYCCLTGRTPMAAASEAAHAMTAPPRKFNPRISSEMEAVVMKAIRWRPEDRYPDMDAMAAALTPGHAPRPVPPSHERPQPPTAADRTCPGCGRINRRQATFCTGCGGRLAADAGRTCRRCGALAGARAAFCRECGAPLTAALCVLQGDETRAELPLSPGANIIGRNSPPDNIYPDIDLTPWDSERSVSRRHLRLELLADGRCIITDLHSHNGTWINGRRAPAGVCIQAPAGAALTLGRVTVQVRT